MSLTLILGGMFAGKTTELMRRVARFESLRYTALVVNSTRDTRCGANEIGSHEGKRRLATKVDRISDACVPADTRVIAIDEGQFFPDLPLIVDFADAGYHVIVAGLNGTTEQAPFGHILSLVPHADEVVWCALCHVCNDGTPASFSIPRDDSSSADHGDDDGAVLHSHRRIRHVPSGLPRTLSDHSTVKKNKSYIYIYYCTRSRSMRGGGGACAAGNRAGRANAAARLDPQRGQLLRRGRRGKRRTAASPSSTSPTHSVSTKYSSIDSCDESTEACVFLSHGIVNRACAAHVLRFLLALNSPWS